MRFKAWRTGGEQRDRDPDLSFPYETSDYFSTSFVADPYGGYSWLRNNNPVVEIDQPDGLKVWLLTRYDDVRAAMTDSRLSKDPRNAAEQLREAPVVGLVASDGRVNVNNLLNADRSDHTRLRAVISRQLQPARVERIRPWIQQIVDGMLRQVEPGRPIDLIEHVAHPLPVIVISRVLGMDKDRALNITRWREDMAYPSYIDVLPTPPDSATELFEFISGVLEERKRTSDGVGDCDRAIYDDLIAAHRDGTINDDELVGMATSLFIAGTESTTNFIGNGMLALLTHPSQCEFLKNNPQDVPAAVEELLRFDGPAEKATFRVATEDVEYSGTTIPQGGIVGLAINSANRDSARFREADDLVLSRDASSHMSFGHGPHFCLGAPLARIETQITFQALLQKFPSMRLAVDSEKLQWRVFGPHRGLRSLPVVPG